MYHHIWLSYFWMNSCMNYFLPRVSVSTTARNCDNEVQKRQTLSYSLRVAAVFWFLFNPFNLALDINMYIHITNLHTFLMELVRRICLNIKTSYPQWSLPLFLSLECLNKWSCKEKFHFHQGLGLKGLTAFILPLQKTWMKFPLNKAYFR